MVEYFKAAFLSLVENQKMTTTPGNIARPFRSVGFGLLICFFFSGACGLMYEMVWLRVMGLVFGNTTYATSTVLAGYMAGLGLGALYFGKWADRQKNPVKAYGFLEAGVALYAVITPLLWMAIEYLNLHFYQRFQPSFFSFSLFKFAVSFLFLLFPTFLMGGTLPVLSKFYVRDRSETAKQVGLLYALNTLGAVAGVLFSIFVSLHMLGVWQTVMLTAVINAMIFAYCFFHLSRLHAYESQPLSNAPAQTAIDVPVIANDDLGIPKDRLLSFLALVIFGISGAASMMYEVAWTRVLALVLGSSIYAFAVMLSTFLLGIAIGSSLFSLLGKRLRVDLSTFSILQILISISALIGMNGFEKMPYKFVELFRVSGGNMWAMELGRFLMSGSVMVLPTILIGAVFACFIHLYHRSGHVGHDVGVAYFANTIGTIFGSALTGFLIIPLIGIQKTLIAAAAMNTAVGVIAQGMIWKRGGWKKGLVPVSLMAAVGFAGLLVKPWNASIMTSGAAVKPHMFQASEQEYLMRLTEREILFYKEGASTTVNVTRSRDVLALAVNGKVEASNFDDMFNQVLLGHLPILLHGNAKDVMVIGLGSGTTVAAVAAHPSVQRIDSVEIEEAVIRAAGFFSVVNRDVLKDPRVNMIVNDGRNYLLINPTQYDVIISEPSNPWMAGVANLFSLEHYQTVSKRLKPGGIICQWLHAYNLSSTDVAMIVKTFRQVFPNATLWVSDFPDLLLIGSNDPYTINLESMQKEFHNPLVAQDLRAHGVIDAEGLISSYWLGEQELGRLSQKAKINSDNHPYLEFSAPRSLYRNTTIENFEAIDRFRGSDYPAMIGLDPPPVLNQKFHNSLARGFVARKMMARAQRELLISSQIGPVNAEMYELIGILNYSLGQLRQADEYLAKALTQDDQLPEAHFFSGLLFRAVGHKEKAAEHLEKAVKLDPDNRRYLTEFGDLLASQEKFGDARQLYEKVLQLGGENFSVILKMADTIYRTGTAEEQSRITQKILEKYSKSYVAYEFIGSFYERQNNNDEALKVYQTAISELPKDPRSYINLARVYDRLRRPQDALRALKTASGLNTLVRQDPKVMATIRQLQAEVK